MDAPHPDVKLRHGDGWLEVWMTPAFPKPIAYAERLRDGSWVAVVRPLQVPGSERAVIVASEEEARERLRPWCHEHAWRYRPNVGPYSRGGNAGHRGAEKSDSAPEPPDAS